MRHMFKKIFIIIAIVSALLLASCGVEGPEPISWSSPVEKTNMTPVEPYASLLDQISLKTPTPGLPHSFILSIALTGFCDGNPEHGCVGDFHNGWREFYHGSSLTAINFFVLGEQLMIEVVDGEYYLVCGSTRKPVTDTYVNNLQRGIGGLIDAQKEYEDASQDAASNVGWSIGGGIVACVAGILIAGVTIGMGWPAVGAGCGFGGIAGIIGGGVTAWGSSNDQTSRAKQEIEDAQAKLERLTNQCP